MSNIKNIAFFTSSFNSGGVERAFVNLANTFFDNGHNVYFVVSHGSGILKNELNPSINIISFSGVRLRGSFRALYKFLKKTDLDAVFSGPTYPNIILILCSLITFKKTKIIVSQHSYQDLEAKNIGLAGKMMPFLIKKTYNYADKVIAVSDGVKHDLINNYNISTSKVITIYNAVIDENFYIKANAVVENVFISKFMQTPYFVAVGRLEPIKNYSFMIDVFHKLSVTSDNFNYKLIIIGEGSEYHKIQQHIERLNLQNHIFLTGGLGNPFQIIKSAKVLIHTSFSETMGLVYVEALALKVPVVTVSNNGALEILKNVKPKIIIEKHNIDDFIDGLNTILNLNYVEQDFPDLQQFDSKIIAKKCLQLI